MEQRERETRQRELNVQVNNIIENCKRVARNGVRKYDVPLDKDYKKEGPFSSGSTRTYDINCPHKYEDLRDELVRHGFRVSFYMEEGITRYGVDDRYYSVETRMIVRW